MECSGNGSGLGDDDSVLFQLMRGGPMLWPTTFKTKGELATKADSKRKAYVLDRITVPLRRNGR